MRAARTRLFDILTSGGMSAISDAVAAHADPSASGGRRAFLQHISSLPLLGTLGSSTAVRRTDVAAEAVIRLIDATVLECVKATRAEAQAIDLFERSLPRMHPHLDLTERGALRRRAPIERGLFNEQVNRAVRADGGKTHRFIGTAAFFRNELEHEPGDRYVRRMIRRAERYEAALDKLKARIGADEIRAAKAGAFMKLNKLGEAIFAQPASTPAAIRVQAHMICAFADIEPEAHATWQISVWGRQIARAIQTFGAVE